jgi:DNA repair exonuclease SbcCD ATPase subunit
MKLTFKNLKIQNFMSIGDAELDLQENNFVLVKGENNNLQDVAGSNGSGKSSIFDAIVWCLTGETSRGTKDIVNIHGTDGAYVELTFLENLNKFKLVRTKNHSKYATNLYIYINDENKSGKGIRDSEKLLKEYLPELTSSLISSVIIIGQGMPAKFTGNSPAGRKELLEKLSATDSITNEFRESVTSRFNKLTGLQRNKENELLVKTTNLKNYKTQLEEKNSRKSELEKISEYKNILQEKNKEKSLFFSDLEVLKEQYTAAEKNLNTFKSELQNIQEVQNKDVSKIKETYFEQEKELCSSIERTAAEMEFQKQELIKLNSIVDICPTCGQKLLNVHKPDTTNLQNKIFELEKSYKNLNEQLKSCLFLRDTEINKVLSHYQVLINSKKENAVEAEKTVYMAEKQIKQKQEQLNKVESDISGLTFLINELEKISVTVNTEIKNLQENINTTNESLSCIELELADLKQRISCNQIIAAELKRDFRNYMLSSTIECLNLFSKQYSNTIFSNKEVQIIQNKNTIDVLFGNIKYENLSGGEKQKVDLIIQFSIRDMMQQRLGFSCSILVLDEIFDNLDEIGCKKIIDTISQKLTDISSIYIISHHADELDIPVDKVITVSKDEHGISNLM